MKIIFDLVNCGLADNGGSSTIIKSCNVLKDLVESVIVIDKSKNYHTWEKLNVQHKIISSDEDIPKADIVLATGYNTVKHVIRLSPKVGKQFHWIRGWETWLMPEDKIVQRILSPKTIKIVNSICLQRKLKSYGFESYIIRPGYDFDHFTELHLRGKRKGEIIIGGLYSEGGKRATKRASWIFETVSYLRSKNINAKLWMFGIHDSPKSSLVNHYLKAPKIPDKNILYNNVDIWLAPTELEGLHIVPAEAMLTGCPVIATDAEMSGVQDYLENEKNGLISKNKLDSFKETTLALCNDKNYREKLGSSCRNSIIKIGSRKENMKKMIDLFDDFLKGKENELSKKS